MELKPPVQRSHVLLHDGCGETTDEQRLEDTAAYLVCNPLSLEKLVYLDGEKAVVYHSRMNPFLGRNFEAMDPLEWLARLSSPASAAHPAGDA